MAELSIKQELAINELLKGNSIVDSAKNVRVSEATLNRWLVQEDFKNCLNDRKKLLVNDCIDRLKLMGNKAINVLNDILDKGTNDYVRLNTAKSVLDFILKFNEQELIIDKVNEIELLLQQNKESEKNGYS